MPTEKSAGAIVFRKETRTVASKASKLPPGHSCSMRDEEGKIHYLLLRYPPSKKAKKEYWDLPKGHVEKGEKEIDTVRREIEEETGLKDIIFVSGFREVIKYFFRFNGKTIFKTVIFFLTESRKKEIRISEEHLDYKWLPFQEASKKLTFRNAKNILKKADNFISKKGL